MWKREKMTTTTLPRPTGESRVSRVKSRYDLAEVVRSHGVALKDWHRYSMGRRPFHDDSTPSFMVAPEEQRYNCFVGLVCKSVRRDHVQTDEHWTRRWKHCVLADGPR